MSGDQNCGSRSSDGGRLGSGLCNESGDWSEEARGDFSKRCKTDVDVTNQGTTRLSEQLKGALRRPCDDLIATDPTTESNLVPFFRVSKIIVQCFEC